MQKVDHGMNYCSDVFFFAAFSNFLWHRESRRPKESQPLCDWLCWRNVDGSVLAHGQPVGVSQREVRLAFVPPPPASPCDGLTRFFFAVRTCALRIVKTDRRNGFSVLFEDFIFFYELWDLSFSFARWWIQSGMNFKKIYKNKSTLKKYDLIIIYFYYYWHLYLDIEDWKFDKKMTNNDILIYILLLFFKLNWFFLCNLYWTRYIGRGGGYFGISIQWVILFNVYYFVEPSVNIIIWI